MMMKRVACTFVALTLAGCGGGDGAGIPAELVGTYTTTLEQSDLPADPAIGSSTAVQRGS